MAVQLLADMQVPLSFYFASCTALLFISLSGHLLEGRPQIASLVVLFLWHRFSPLLCFVQYIYEHMFFHLSDPVYPVDCLCI